jgi:IS30 family transposase
MESHRPTRKSFDWWTPRETEIAQRLRDQGFSYHQIGRQLGRHPSTVHRNLNEWAKEKNRADWHKRIKTQEERDARAARDAARRESRAATRQLQREQSRNEREEEQALLRARAYLAERSALLQD